MSANCLLNKLCFDKASSFEVVDCRENKLPPSETPGKNQGLGACQREILFTFKFSQPVVIQRLKLHLSKEKGRAFGLVKVEGNLLGDLIDYETFSGTEKQATDAENTDGNMEVYNSKGVGEMIRVRFSCFGKNCLQVHNSTEDIYKAFLKEYSAVSFYGLMSERNMKPQTSGELLNISLYFRKENLYLSANEVEIILSLALINEGKVIQAREILTKSINFLDYCTNGIIEHLMRLKNHDFSFTSVQKILRQITKIRFRCCLLELLRSTLFKSSDCFDERVRSLSTAATLYSKSKKQDKSFPADGDCRILFASIYDTLLLIAEDVLKSDYADHFKLAAVDTLFFGLIHQELISKDQLVASVRIAVEFAKRMADKGIYNWDTEKPGQQNLSYDSLKMALEEVLADCEVANKAMKQNLIEVDSNGDPYLNTRPMIYNAIFSYITNLASLLPCLSAYILHKTLDILLETNVLFFFTMPTKVSLALARVVEKIVVICQADVRIPVTFFSTFLTFMTVLNNTSYRQKIEKAFSDCSDLQPCSKEIFAVYLQIAKPEAAEDLVASFGTLWDTLKSKYIFLVGVPDLKTLLVQIARRLHELSRELDSQVFTSEFATFESRNKSNEVSGLNELKFEKIKSRQDPVPVSTKDLTKSKLEYLKNFRDIFGELEYQLELVDCISANLKEKVLIFNHMPEPLKDGEANLDQVSKKLISNFSKSGLQIVNSMDAVFWESANEVINKMEIFLKTFLRDGVFVDYFQSTWVIACTFLSVREQMRNERINKLLYSVLKEVEGRAETHLCMAHAHILKCLHYLLEHTSKFMFVHYDSSTNDLLVGLLSKLLVQVRHTQNSDLIRVVRFLMAKFPEVIANDSIPDLFTLFLEPYFDLESESAIKLVDQLLDVCSKKQDKDDIYAMLIQIVVCSGSSAAIQKQNMERRMQILAKRQPKQRVTLAAKATKQQVRSEIIKKLRLLSIVVERTDSKLLVDILRLTYLTPATGRMDAASLDTSSDYSNVTLSFLRGCLQLGDAVVDLLVIRVCVLFLQRVRPSSSHPAKSSIIVCDFVFHLVRMLCNRQFLEAESQHELLVCCLLIFSDHLPPAPFETEVDIHEECERLKLAAQDQTNASDNPGPAQLYIKSRESTICSLAALKNKVKRDGKLSYGEINYTNVRLYEFLKVFIPIRHWADSPWSSIRGLFCNLVGFAVPCNSLILDECLLTVLKAELSGLLAQLLNSKESESVINGLNIMGALFGFGMDLTQSKKAVTDNLGFFKRNSMMVPITIWEKVFMFQENWDITIQIASILILQLALPGDYAQYLYKKRKQRVKMNVENSRSFEAPTLKQDLGSEDQIDQSDKENGGEVNVARQLLVSSDARGNITDKSLDVFLKQIHAAKNSKAEQRVEKISFSLTGFTVDNFSADNSLVDINWLEKKFQEEELIQLLSLFRMHFAREEHKWASLKVSNKDLEIVFEAGKPESSPKDKNEQPPIVVKVPEKEINKEEILLEDVPQQLQVVALPTKTVQRGTDIRPVRENVFSKELPTGPSKVASTLNIKCVADFTPSMRIDEPDKRFSSPKPTGDIYVEKPRFMSRNPSPCVQLDQPRRKKSRDSQAENPVKRIIKMKEKLFEADSLAIRTMDSAEKVILDSLDPTHDFVIPHYSLQDFHKASRNKQPATVSSAMSYREQDSSSGGRKSATRREINRILSSHFIKPPVDGSIKYATSPKSMPVTGNKSAGLTRGAQNSASKPRILSKTRDKNSSVGFLGDKSGKFQTFHNDSGKERPSLSKKSSHLLSNLKKKMLSNLGNPKKSGQLATDRVSKRNLGSIANKGPELRPKLTTGQGRGTSNLLRSSANE